MLMLESPKFASCTMLVPLLVYGLASSMACRSFISFSSLGRVVL